MKYTTVIVARDGSVFDLGDTRLEDLTIQGKDGKEKQVKLRRPVAYPPTLICPPGGSIRNPKDIPAFSMGCTQDYCDRLMKMKKKEVIRHFKLQ